MLPGTYAYVAAGHLGKAVMVDTGNAGALSVAPWQIALGAGATLGTIAFIGQLAKRAVEEADAEARAEEEAAAAAAAGAAREVVAPEPHGGAPEGDDAGGDAAGAPLLPLRQEQRHQR